LKQVGQSWLIRDDSSTNGSTGRAGHPQLLLCATVIALRFGPPSEPGPAELVFRADQRPRCCDSAASATGGRCARIAGVRPGWASSTLRVPCAARRGARARPAGPLRTGRTRPLIPLNPANTAKNKNLRRLSERAVEGLLP